MFGRNKTNGKRHENWPSTKTAPKKLSPETRNVLKRMQKKKRPDIFCIHTFDDSKNRKIHFSEKLRRIFFFLDLLKHIPKNFNNDIAAASSGFMRSGLGDPEVRTNTILIKVRNKSFPEKSGKRVSESGKS